MSVHSVLRDNKAKIDLTLFRVKFKNLTNRSDIAKYCAATAYQTISGKYDLSNSNLKRIVKLT